MRYLKPEIDDPSRPRSVRYLLTPISMGAQTGRRAMCCPPACSWTVFNSLPTC